MVLTQTVYLCLVYIQNVATENPALHVPHKQLAKHSAGKGIWQLPCKHIVLLMCHLKVTQPVEEQTSLRETAFVGSPSLVLLLKCIAIHVDCISCIVIMVYESKYLLSVSNHMTIWSDSLSGQSKIYYKHYYLATMLCFQSNLFSSTYLAWNSTRGYNSVFVHVCMLVAPFSNDRRYKWWETVYKLKLWQVLFTNVLLHTLEQWTNPACYINIW